MTTVSFYQLLYFTLSIVYIYKYTRHTHSYIVVVTQNKKKPPISQVKSKKQQIEFTPDNEMGRISSG